MFNVSTCARSTSCSFINRFRFFTIALDKVFANFISWEASKHGLPPEGWKEAFQEIVDLPGITVKGLMTMALFVEDREVVGRCFAALRKLRDDLGGACSPSTPVDGNDP